MNSTQFLCREVLNHTCAGRSSA